MQPPPARLLTQRASLAWTRIHPLRTSSERLRLHRRHVPNSSEHRPFLASSRCHPNAANKLQLRSPRSIVDRMSGSGTPKFMVALQDNATPLRQHLVSLFTSSACCSHDILGSHGAGRQHRVHVVGFCVSANRIRFFLSLRTSTTYARGGSTPGGRNRREMAEHHSISLKNPRFRLMETMTTLPSCSKQWAPASKAAVRSTHRRRYQLPEHFLVWIQSPSVPPRDAICLPRDSFVDLGRRPLNSVASNTSCAHTF